MIDRGNVGKGEVSLRMEQRRLLVIYNPTAGRRHEKRFWKILRLLEARGSQLTLSHTLGPGHATELARAAQQNPEISAVIAAGGDGTLGEVAQGLSGSDMPLGLIPLGTANVFAFEIGVGTTISKIVNTIVDGQQVKIWPGLIEGRRFMLMVGCGYDAMSVAGLNIAEKRTWGALAYLIAAFRVRRRFSKMRVSVKIGDEKYEAASVIVSRARKYGGPFTVFPKADLRRQDFQLLLLKGGSVGHAMIYACAMLFGCLEKLKSVEILATRNAIKISAIDELPSQRDGDLDMSTPFRLSVDTVPLYFLMPKEKN